MVGRTLNGATDGWLVAPEIGDMLGASHTDPNNPDYNLKIMNPTFDYDSTLVFHQDSKNLISAFLASSASSCF